VKETSVSLQFHGYKLTFSQRPDAEDVAFLVWEGAIVLANYLEQYEFISNKRCIELGSGTGLLGICAALLGADVVVTDLEKVVSFMEENVARNCSSDCKIRVTAHTWGTQVSELNPPYDLIIASDVVYALHIAIDKCSCTTDTMKPSLHHLSNLSLVCQT